MTEVFKTIEGYENYSVSNMGRVLNNQTGKFLKGSTMPQGYQQINLYKDSVTIHRTLLHRLVAEAFIPNPENKEMIDHRNNNTSNNSVENLRWATRQENAFNSQLSIRNITSIKGVVFNKTSQKWRARIWIDNKSIHIGCYDTKEEATLARQTRANEVFGEFVNDCEMLTC